MFQGDPETPFPYVNLQTGFLSSEYQLRLSVVNDQDLSQTGLTQRRCMGLCFQKVPRSWSLLVWMDPEVQMMSLRISPISQLCFHSPTDCLQVAERWPVVAPDLYCPDCFQN